MSQIPLVSYLQLDPPRLVANKCDSCGARYFDRRNACANCGNTSFSTVEVDNNGVLKSYTIVHRAAANIEVPFVAGIIQTNDGTWVRANVINCDPTPEAVKLNMAVQLVTYSAGTDDNDTTAISFGYEPA